MSHVAHLNEKCYIKISRVAHTNDSCCTHVMLSIMMSYYWVATISRVLQIIGLFCRISLFYRALLQKRRIILGSLLIVATP